MISKFGGASALNVADGAADANALSESTPPAPKLGG